MNFLSPRLLRSFFILFASQILTPLAPQFAHAQSQSSPPAHKAPPPRSLAAATDQQQFLSYWTTETGWRTELQLRNNQVGHILTVTPVLRTADGAETPLFPIVVQPQEVKTVDVATAVGSSAPQLIGTYGSVALRYSAPSQINLYAVSMVMGVGHSIAFHIDATGEDQTENVGSREGIWWLPNGTANDYLVLLNQGQNPLQLILSLFDASGKAYVQNITLPPRGMNRVSVRQIVSAAKLSGSYGGIKVSAVHHAGSLDTLHVLFDQDAGFFAVMKMFFYDPRAQLQERDYAGTGQWTIRAPMLALSSPDPALAFPVGTLLQPELFVRNTTSKPIDALLSFNWRTDTTTGNSPGHTLHLIPYETRRIDVAALQDGKTLPQKAQWASVTMATTALPDEVVAVAASYDQSLHYGAQTPFSDQLAVQWEGGQWQYDPQHDSIITAGNGSSKPTQVAFTIFYNEGATKYELDQTLQPGEQMWMDIGKLIREGVPDKNGNTLPANLTSGSYDFRDLSNNRVGTLFEGKVIYDKTYGHVTYGCAACCGWGIPYLWYDPLSVIITALQDDGVYADYPCESEVDDVSNTFYNTWVSEATSVATVNYYGTHTGVSVGSTTSYCSALLTSNDAHERCPALARKPTAPVNTTPKVTIDSLAPNPIPQSGTATAHVTVDPAANIELSISSGGTGTATFGTGGNTTLQITETTAVTVTAGNLSSNGSPDLTLSSSYNGAAVPNAFSSAQFSVTTGACTATYASSTGSGLYACPSNVQISDKYNLQQYCGACSFSCVPISFDSTFTPSGCTPTTGSIQGAGNQVLTATETGRFAPSDCSLHGLQIQTTVTNAQGTTTTKYVGGNIGLQCNANGSPVCN
jgi:hypothetical protein